MPIYFFLDSYSYILGAHVPEGCSSLCVFLELKSFLIKLLPALTYTLHVIIIIVSNSVFLVLNGDQYAVLLYASLVNINEYVLP